MQNQPAIASSVSPERNASPRGAARTSVLVVEDEQDIAGLIKLTLEKNGEIDVEIVNSGDAA